MSKPFICTACGAKFTSVVGFDKHRTGKFTDEHPNYGRSCHPESAIPELGMVKDEDDRWYNPKLRPEA